MQVGKESTFDACFLFRNKISSVLRLSYILCYWFIHRNHDGRPILPINVTVLPHISSSRSFRIWLKYVATSLDKTCHLIVVYISIVGKYQKMDGNMAAAASFLLFLQFYHKFAKRLGPQQNKKNCLAFYERNNPAYLCRQLQTWPNINVISDTFYTLCCYFPLQGILDLQIWKKKKPLILFKVLCRECC